IFIETSGHLTVQNTTIDLSGGIDASVVAYASLSISKSDPSSPLDVSMDAFSITIEEAKGAFDDPQANAIFELAEGTLRTKLESKLEGSLESLLDTTIPAVIENTLGALDTALKDKAITL